LRITCVATAGDGQRAAYATADGTVCIWELGKATPRYFSCDPRAAVRSLVFSPDNRFLLIAGDVQPLTLLDTATAKSVSTFDKLNPAAIRSLAFTPDGKRAVSGGSDGAVRVWDVARGQQIECFKSGDQAVNSVAVSPDGRRAVSAGDDQKLHLWALPRPVAR
jgi:WD40 repeat protein